MKRDRIDLSNWSKTLRVVRSSTILTAQVFIVSDRGVVSRASLASGRSAVSVVLISWLWCHGMELSMSVQLMTELSYCPNYHSQYNDARRPDGNTKVTLGVAIITCTHKHLILLLMWSKYKIFSVIDRPSCRLVAMCVRYCAASCSQNTQSIYWYVTLLHGQRYYTYLGASLARGCVQFSAD